MKGTKYQQKQRRGQNRRNAQGLVVDCRRDEKQGVGGRSAVRRYALKAHHPDHHTVDGKLDIRLRSHTRMIKRKTK